MVIVPEGTSMKLFLVLKKVKFQKRKNTITPTKTNLPK